jgi:hypothetical protein
MSFLKKLLKKSKLKEKIVYDLNGEEVGEISSIQQIEQTRAYNIVTKDAKIKLSFPADQFFIDENGKFYLLPKWLHYVRLSYSNLLRLNRKFEELNTLIAVVETETYIKEITNIMKEAVPYGEKIIQYLPRFEEYLIELQKKKTEIINETSHLMTLRLLEFGSQSKNSTSTPLTKKEYSLKIIELRRKYENILRAIQFVSKLYKSAKDSMKFIKQFLEYVYPQRKIYVSITPEMQTLMKKANNICLKGKEITKIMDSLIEIVITTKPP